MTDNFDPDSYLAAKESAPAPAAVDNTQLRQFDPDSYLNKKASSIYDTEQDKYGGLGNEVLSGLAGAARGGTLGLSDLAAVKAGLVDPQTLAGLSQANPLSSGAGQLAGGAALIAGTGGVGALAEGTGALGAIAGSALEGGIFGAGNAVSDYAMGDPTLNAQKIAAHIGTGALFGAGLGTLGETFKAILPKATEALTGALGKLKDMAIGTEETPGVLNDIAPDWAAKFKQGLTTGIEDQTIKPRELIKNLQDLHASSKQAANALYEEAAPANIGEALKDMPTITAKDMGMKTIQDMKQGIHGFDENGELTTPLSSPTSVKIVNTALQDLEDSINKSQSAYDVQNSLSDFAKEIDAKKIIKFDKLPTAAQMADQEVLMNLRNTVRGDLKNPDLWGDAATHYQQLSDNYSAYKTSLRNFQSNFMKSEVAPSGLKRFTVDPSKVNTFFNRFDDVSQDLRKQYLNDFINQADNLGKASENYHGFVKGADSISDHIADLAKKNEDLGKVAQIMAANGSAKTGIGTPGILAVAAHAVGVPDSVVGAGLGAVKAYQQIANPYQLGANLQGVFSKLKAIGDIVQKATNSIDSGAKSIFSGNTARAVSSGVVGVSEKQYNKNANRIQELSNNPQTLMDHLDKTTSALNEAAPNISTGLHSTITNGIQFLNTKLPKPANELPLNTPWKPTTSQKMKFNKYFGAVDDPINTLKQVKNGVLSNESMEALQAVHPELLQQMQQAVMSNMDPKKIPKLNYSTKIALSKFIGQPLESSMSPQVFAANQAALAPQVANASQQPQQQPKINQKAVGKIGLADRSLTRTQQLEKEVKPA